MKKYLLIALLTPTLIFAEDKSSYNLSCYEINTQGEEVKALVNVMLAAESKLYSKQLDKVLLPVPGEYENDTHTVTVKSQGEEVDNIDVSGLDFVVQDEDQRNTVKMNSLYKITWGRVSTDYSFSATVQTKGEGVDKEAQAACILSRL